MFMHKYAARCKLDRATSVADKPMLSLLNHLYRNVSIVIYQLLLEHEVQRVCILLHVALLFPAHCVYIVPKLVTFRFRALLGLHNNIQSCVLQQLTLLSARNA